METKLVTTWDQDIDAAKESMARSAYSALEAGRLFSEAKRKHREQFGGTGWQQVVEGRGVSRKTADELINVYNRFGNSPEYVNFLGSSVMLQLAPPGVPQTAVTEVVERAESGEKITVKVAEEIIAQAKAEARQEQLALDREELRKAVKLSEDRVSNMEAVVQQATAARRLAEKQVSELEQRMATGPSAKLKQDLEDAQDKLYKEKQRVDGLEVALIGEKNRVRELQLSRQTSDTARDMRRLFSDTCTRATAALVELTGYEVDSDYFIEATWRVVETLAVQLGRATMMLNSLNRGSVVDAD